MKYRKIRHYKYLRHVLRKHSYLHFVCRILIHKIAMKELVSRTGVGIKNLNEDEVNVRHTTVHGFASRKIIVYNRLQVNNLIAVAVVYRILTM